MEKEMEKKEKKDRKEKAEPVEEEKKPELTMPKPKPEYIPPKPEAASKLPEEKPMMNAVKPKPEFVAPTTPRSMMSRNAERTFSYLKEHGLSSPLRIAKDLNMAPMTTMKALRELEKHDKILLQVWTGGDLKGRKRVNQR
jgi:hypothetical protein